MKRFKNRLLRLDVAGLLLIHLQVERQGMASRVEAWSVAVAFAQQLRAGRRACMDIASEAIDDLLNNAEILQVGDDGNSIVQVTDKGIATAKRHASFLLMR